MKKLLSFFAASSQHCAWSSVLLLRFWVGAVFILAGYRKFAEPESMGSGRFEEMGLPFPQFLGPWVGFWEIAGGIMVLAGILTRAGAIPLIITMIVAILTTKVPQFQESVVQGLHASRLDFALLMTSLYLLIVGGGRYGFDRLIREKLTSEDGGPKPARWE